MHAICDQAIISNAVSQPTPGRIKGREVNKLTRAGHHSFLSRAHTSWPGSYGGSGGEPLPLFTG
eukprot:2424948-Rhodomonas_salina.2